MPFIVTERVVKPAEVAWWGHAHPNRQEVLDYWQWMNSQPGVIWSFNEVDSNTIDVFYKAQTEQDYNNLIAARENNTTYQARKAYVTANNIQTVSTTAETV